MRQIGIALIIWVGVSIVAFVGLDGLFGGTTFLAVTRPDVLLALEAAPLVVASFFWPPWAVAALVVVLSPWILEMILAADHPAQLWPVAAALLVIDAYAICLARQREETGRQARACAALEHLGRLASEAPTIEEFADAVQEHGTDLVREGRLRLWVLDRTGRALRLIATGDDAVIARDGRKGQISVNLPTLALADPDPCARAARLGQIVAVTDRRAKGQEMSALERTAEHEGYHSVLAVPLRRHGRRVGVLTFEPRSRRRHAFSARERAVLQTVAGLSAVAVEGIASGAT